MKLHVPICIPFVSGVEATARAARLLVLLPFVDEVSIPLFRRRWIRRMVDRTGTVKPLFPKET